MQTERSFIVALLAFILAAIAPQAHAAHGTASSILGTTPEQIGSRFTSVIDLNVQTNPFAIDNLTESELADLAYTYGAANDGNFDVLSKIFAARLPPAALVRLTPYFGTENIRRALVGYAKPAVLQSYEKLLLRSSKRKANISSGLVRPTAAPTIDMTPYEIYLEFRTAPIGSLTPGSALAEAGMFMATKLSIAGGAGWVVGCGINELIETYDPELDDKIGGTIDAALTNISDAGSSIQEGKYEEALDKIFGGAITEQGDKTGDYSGDYDVSESYDRLEDWDDKCDPRVEDCR